MGMPNSSFSLRQPGGRFLLLMIKNASCHVVLDKERRPLLNAVAPFRQFCGPARSAFGIIDASLRGEASARGIFNPLVQGELFHGGV